MISTKDREFSGIDRSIKGIQRCETDLSKKGDSYLIAFATDENKIKEEEFNNVEQKVSNNVPGYIALIARCKFMGNTFFAINKKEQSMLIKNEKVESIQEYAE